MENVIFGIAIAYVWIYFLQIPYRFNQKLNFKPLNCYNCLSGWITLILFIFNSSGYNFWQIVGFMSISMVLSIFIERLINRL
jgi:hypothetical protein